MFFHNQSTAANRDAAWQKRGFRLGESAAGLFQRQPPSSASQTSQKGVNPKILIAFGLTALFFCASMMFANAGSSNTIRPKLPALRTSHESYVQVAAQTPKRAALAWPEIERRLQDIAHFSQLEDWPQVRQRLTELQQLDGDLQSPIYRFCEDLLKGLPAQ